MTAQALSDTTLDRLLAGSSDAPPMPGGLAGRIMANLPAQPAKAAEVAPRPNRQRHNQPREQRRPGGAGRRWVRAGIATVSGLGLATAVAAAAARTPLFAPTLGPVMERIAEATGIAALAPPKPAVPSPSVAPAGANRVPGLHAPSLHLEQTPLAPPNPPAPALSPLPQAPLDSRATGANLPPSAGSVETALEAARRNILARDRARNTALPLQAPSDRAAPAVQPPTTRTETLRQRDPAERRTGEGSGQERTAEPLAERIAPARSLDSGQIAERIGQRQAAVPGAAPPDAPPTTTAQAPGVDARPATPMQIDSEIAALREARRAGELTSQQAQRLRALQRLRSARAARRP